MKICRICQQDCSAKPRVRDPEGNYYCKACLEERQAKQKAPAAAPAGDPFSGPAEEHAAGDEGYGLADLMGDSGDSGPSTEGSMMCPECGNAIRVGAALCMRCGYDPAKGKSMRTTVSVEREPKERKRTSNTTIFLQSLFDESPILPLVFALVLGGLFIPAMDNPDIALLYFAIGGLIGFGIWLWGLVLMFMESVVHALGGFICWFYWLYWVIVHSENRALQLLTLVSILGSIIGRIAIDLPEVGP